MATNRERLYRMHLRFQYLLGTSSEILEIMHRIRGGGAVSKLAAAVSATRVLLPLVAPNYVLGWQAPRNFGYEEVYPGAVVHDLLQVALADMRPANTVVPTPNLTVVTYSTAAGDIHLAFSGPGDRMAINTYLGSPEPLIEIMGKFWEQGEDLYLDRPNDRLPGRESTMSAVKSSVSLTALPEPGDYVGGVDLPSLATRLSRVPGGQTVLVIGPTGSGKSVLARRLPRELVGVGRTLKVSSTLARIEGSTGLMKIVQYLQPRVLLLEDWTLNSTTENLELLEVLRAHGLLTIVTVMAVPPKKARGSLYVEGMRPKRIDEVVVLDYPTEEERAEILRHYYEKFGVSVTSQQSARILEGTVGYTGAYLERLVLTLSIYGVENWQRELELLSLLAPPLQQ